jgi:hypothetical protein
LTTKQRAAFSNLKPNGSVDKLGNKILLTDSFYKERINFSFRYISLDKTKYCFNNKKAKTSDYTDLFKGLQQISGKNYKEIDQGRNTWRFHPIDIDKPGLNFPKEKLLKILKKQALGEIRIPTMFQFSVGGGKRVVGFIGDKGIFYFVFFDFEHNIYSNKKF